MASVLTEVSFIRAAIETKKKISFQSAVKEEHMMSGWQSYKEKTAIVFY